MTGLAWSAPAGRAGPQAARPGRLPGRVRSPDLRWISTSGSSNPKNGTGPGGAGSRLPRPQPRSRNPNGVGSGAGARRRYRRVICHDPASNSVSGLGFRATGEVPRPRVSEVGPAARSPAAFLELGVAGSADGRPGDLVPPGGHLGLSAAPAGLVHLAAQLIAVTALGLGQFSRFDGLSGRHSPASGSARAHGA